MYKADVWAFGCLIYEMALREVPWTHTGLDYPALDNHVEQRVVDRGNEELFLRLTPRQDAARHSARHQQRGLKEQAPILYELLNPATSPSCWATDPRRQRAWKEQVEKK